MKEAQKIFKTARDEGRTFVLEHEAKDIMKAYGIPIPPYATASTADDAVEKSKGIGFPVVLKILSKDILHKSDAGGVKLNLKDVGMTLPKTKDLPIQVGIVLLGLPVGIWGYHHLPPSRCCMHWNLPI